MNIIGIITELKSSCHSRNRDRLLAKFLLLDQNDNFTAKFTTQRANKLKSARVSKHTQRITKTYGEPKRQQRNGKKIKRISTQSNNHRFKSSALCLGLPFLWLYISRESTDGGVLALPTRRCNITLSHSWSRKEKKLWKRKNERDMNERKMSNTPKRNPSEGKNDKKSPQKVRE